jgi:hypothetical protein
VGVRPRPDQLLLGGAAVFWRELGSAAAGVLLPLERHGFLHPRPAGFRGSRCDGLGLLALGGEFGTQRLCLTFRLGGVADGIAGDGFAFGALLTQAVRIGFGPFGALLLTFRLLVGNGAFNPGGLHLAREASNPRVGLRPRGLFLLYPG